MTRTKGLTCSLTSEHNSQFCEEWNIRVKTHIFSMVFLSRNGTTFCRPGFCKARTQLSSCTQKNQTVLLLYYNVLGLSGIMHVTQIILYSNENLNRLYCMHTNRIFRIQVSPTLSSLRDLYIQKNMWIIRYQDHDSGPIQNWQWGQMSLKRSNIWVLSLEL